MTTEENNRSRASSRSDIRMIEYLKKKVNMSIVGTTFRKDAKKIIEILELLTPEEGMNLEQKLESNGKVTVKSCDGEQFEISRDMVSFQINMEEEKEVEFVSMTVEQLRNLAKEKGIKKYNKLKKNKLLKLVLTTG